MSPSELFDNNQRLVGLAIKKLGLRPLGILEMNDYKQIGYVGLWRAAQSYDPSRGFLFTTFAMTWIEGLLRVAIRDCGNYGIRVPRSAIKNGENAHIIDFDALISAPSYDYTNNAVFYVDMKNALDKLNLADRDMFSHWLHGETQQEIGQALGLGQPQISRRMKRVRDRIIAACNVS